MNRLLPLLLAAALPASSAERLPDFAFTGAAALKAAAAKADLPAPASAPADEITRGHMHAQAGRQALFGYAKTAGEFAEAAIHWGQLLREAGLITGQPEFRADIGMWTLPYVSRDGRVIRDFMADHRQFPPKDEPGLRADMERSRAAAEAAGLTVLAARVVKLEGMLPSYKLLYLTKPHAKPEREIRLRLLDARGDDIDPAPFRGHVAVVSQGKPWLMVYTGPQVGQVSMGAKDEESARKKLAARKEFLTGQGMTILAESVEPYDDELVKFVVTLSFLF